MPEPAEECQMNSIPVTSTNHQEGEGERKGSEPGATTGYTSGPPGPSETNREEATNRSCGSNEGGHVALHDATLSHTGGTGKSINAPTTYCNGQYDHTKPPYSQPT